MVNGKTIIIMLAVLTALLFPAGLFAENHPSGQLEQSAKGQPEGALPKEALEAVNAAGADEGGSSSEFLRSLDTLVIPSVDDPAETPETRNFFDIPADELDREILSPLSVINQDLKAPVEKNIRMFSSTLKDRFSTWLARSGKYMGMMKTIFRENYLPEELVFLALIESGFNPKAYSWAKASGPWQFIKGTGKRYGLRIDPWVDERRDPIKSTRAAAAYLKDLYDMFGTWSLAMASYNAGEGNVARAVYRDGTLNFWELRKTRSLPAETKEYVPKFLAAKIIAQNPDAYGFQGLQYEAPFEFDEVVLKKSVSLRAAAKYCGVSMEEIKDLNPELLRACTPPNRPNYTLRIPKGTKDAFLENYNNGRDSAWKEYVVRRGDTFKKLSKKFGVPVNEIKQANSIVKLKVGQGIVIPVPEPRVAAVSKPAPEKSAEAVTVSEQASVQAAETAQETVAVVAPALQDPFTASDAVAPEAEQPHAYAVKKGDTLYSIARRFGLSARTLAKTNGISVKSKVRVGQTLALYSDKPETSPVSASANKKTYRVRRGDTIWNISQKFGVSVEQIRKANSIGRRSGIKAGQRLVIPAEVDEAA